MFGGTLKYDPLMRLYDAGSSARTAFAYDGFDRIAEYRSGEWNWLSAQFIHGPGVDEPLVEYHRITDESETRTFLHADERGSIIAVSDDAGYVTAITRFDEFGRSRDQYSRFGFAGMPYETVSELYYSRARMYNPRFGRFMQPDPIGYDDGMNMYVRTKGDPVNRIDPTGTCYGPGLQVRAGVRVSHRPRSTSPT
jgi:RHS repeat-associated protein